MYRFVVLYSHGKEKVEKFFGLTLLVFFIFFISDSNYCTFTFIF